MQSAIPGPSFHLARRVFTRFLAPQGASGNANLASTVVLRKSRRNSFYQAGVTGQRRREVGKSVKFVIAVDGPAASGKGTIASALARDYGLPHLDTGLLYRAVGVLAEAEGHDLENEHAVAGVAQALDLLALDNPAFRTRGAGEAASRVAVHPKVRAALLDLQQRFADQAAGAVLDGRDIGTVIAPGAPAKLFVTASPEVRAMRRWKQLLADHEDLSFDEVLEDIRRRDARDAGRATAPLVMADDAVLLDTSEMTIDAAFREARRLVEIARARQG
jgi:cytidylate kinase